MPHPLPPGYRASVALLAAGQVVSWAILYYAFTSFVLPMQRELGWSAPQMLGAFTLALACWGAAAFVAGRWIDLGRAREVMAGGAWLAAAGLVLWSQARSLPMLYLACALTGAAMAGTLYEAAFASATRRWPAHYRGAVTTLTLVGGFASTLAFPALAWLIPAFGGRETLLGLAAVMAGPVAVANALALRAARAGDEAKPAPAPAGAVSRAVTASAVGPAAEPADATDGHTFEQAVRGRVFWLLAASFTAYSFVIAGFWAHAMPAFADKGWSEAEAVAVLVWVGPAQVAGRALHGLFGARLGARSLGLVVMAGLPLAMALFALTAHPAAMALFALLYGFSNGLVTIVRGTVVPETFGIREVGRIGGALSGIGIAGRAGAPVVTAWLLVAAGGYRGLMLGMAALGVLAFAAFALARPVRTARPAR